MTQTLELESEKFTFPKISPATEAEIVAYLRYSGKFAEIAALAERDALILDLCERLGITVSDEEWQAAGDAFRMEHKLFGVAETNAWLSQQRITVDEWSLGIKVQLLAQQLKEHLFGATVDGYYISNRDKYRRVALSQILVLDLAEAEKIVRMLRDENASFCALALEHSKGKQSQANGGFTGIRFLAEIMPEIAQAISAAKEGEAIGPIQTKLGYHIFRIEKWFPHQLTESAREQILESLFQAWLKEQSNANHRDELRP